MTVPEWLQTALRERRLSVRKSRGPVSSHARDYILVLPLSEAIHMQNLMAGAWLAHADDELDQYNFEALVGAANRLADLIEDPVEIRYECLYGS